MDENQTGPLVDHMAEVSCNVVIEDGFTDEVKTVVDFPLRLNSIGMVQYLAQALQSKELDTLVTREGITVSAKPFSRAVLNNGRINGRPVSLPVYTAVERLQDFIADHSGYRVRIYAHWASEPALKRPADLFG